MRYLLFLLVDQKNRLINVGAVDGLFQENVPSFYDSIKTKS
ncbi:hypothetical protein FHS68_001506 [Dyadobacter arcticus]|uniref:RadC-like JAB domain-containing protein n=1 Tax=Dyadobacter arcticus TaxID=1078754 RepID=A0ABX0UL50_9BACT|nr:hypothetical protein [Dyadobacter arcticus]